MVALTQADFRQALKDAEDVQRLVTKFLGDCSYWDDELARTRAMLVCTIVDGLSAVIALLRSHGQSYVNGVVRSMMEALGDLDHLGAPDSAVYFDRLRLTSALHEQADGTNLISMRVGDPSAKAVVDVAKENCKRAKMVIAELQGLRNLEPLSVEERVRGRTLGPDVVGIYSLFCFDAHHDLTALHRRHYRGNQLVIGDTLAPTTAYQALGYAVLIVTLAVAEVNEFAQLVDLQFERVLAQAMSTVDVLMGAGDNALRKLAASRGMPGL